MHNNIPFVKLQTARLTYSWRNGERSLKEKFNDLSAIVEMVLEDHCCLQSS